jgi:hypothetical protein
MGEDAIGTPVVEVVVGAAVVVVVVVGIVVVAGGSVVVTAGLEQATSSTNTPRVVRRIRGIL